MRPLTLAFTGLRSYDTFGPISFEDRTLVGILGDTGAGKSSILEALCVALYGKCSWSDRDVKDLIADGAPTMTVDLTFRHDAHQWRVRRTFYRNTMPSTALLENLDTGAKVDNIRPVDREVIRMLRMDFSAFRSAVLLPQGRFATLLHATDRDRTDLLKGIFGVETVTQVREFARTRRTALSDLLEQARVARAGLLPDPRAESLAAAERATTAEQRTVQLGESIDHLRTRQADTSTAQTEADTLAHALTSVRAAATALHTEHIADLVADAGAADQRISAAEQQASTHHEQVTTQLATAQHALTAAEAAGTSRASLATAAANLTHLAAARVTIADDHARHHDEQQRLARQHAALADEAEAEPAQQRRIAALEQSAENAQSHCDAVHDALTALTDEARELLDAAAELAQQRGELDALQAQAANLAADLPALERAATEADGQLSAARTSLEASQRAAAAAVAGEHLHAGDSCPVCERELPAAYAPPPATDDAALTHARDLYEGTSQSLNLARTRRDEAHRRHEDTTQTVDARAADLRAAQSSFNARVDQIAAWPTLAALVAPGDTSAWPADIDAPAVINPADIATDLAAAARTATAEPTDAGQRRRELVSAVDPARRYARELREAVEQVKRTATSAGSTFASARAQRHEREAAHQRESAALIAAEARLAEQCRELAAAARALPDAIGEALPDPPVDESALIAWMTGMGDAELAAAQAGLEAASNALTEHEASCEDAQRQLTEISETRVALARQRTEDVTARLQRAVHRYETAASTLVDARTIHTDLDDAPATPSDITATAAAEYGSAVTDALTNAARTLATKDSAARARATELTRQLRDQLADALATLTPPRIPAGDDKALLSAAALDAVIDARGAAEHQARTARAERQVAADQIPRAAALDEAITVGALRRAALDELTTLLADGKFATDLTERRTRALLGVASELFSRLSGAEFGFAGGFQIVARRTGTARNAKTLSGGETFLASLALALALVELYSRTAGRLGALFLDEGFAALDVDTLAAALNVLHAESGGDKLVAVISHLHAVAEAVHDVLWVEKNPPGSQARWLTSDEVAGLVRDDAATGLLSLT